MTEVFVCFFKDSVVFVIVKLYLILTVLVFRHVDLHKPYSQSVATVQSSWPAIAYWDGGKFSNHLLTLSGHLVSGAQQMTE